MHPPYPSPEYARSFASPPSPPSGAVRVLAAAGGVVALLLGSLLSFGLGEIALLGLGLVALVWRARGARLTRRASWIGAVLPVSFFLGGLMVRVTAQAPGGVTASMQQSMEQARREPPPPIVQRMRKLGPPQNPRVQQGVDSVTRSKPFLWWAMAMVLTLASLFVGLAVGTSAWGCVMLIGYGVRGRWPMAPPAAAG
ncbi:MAG: hypothetical protein ACJ8GN_12015 [Longimicrobiaceae bacterium]